MPDLPEVQELAEGLDIRARFFDPETDAAIDLTNATEVVLRFKKADGTRQELTMQGGDVILDLTTPGVAYYTTEAGFLTPTGRWEIQGWATTPDGVFPSDRAAFKVMENIAAP